MRTCLATAALFSRRMAMKISAVVALLTVSAAAAFAQPEAGGEAALTNWDLVYRHQIHLIGLNIGVLAQTAPDIFGAVLTERGRAADAVALLPSSVRS